MTREKIRDWLSYNWLALFVWALAAAALLITMYPMFAFGQEATTEAMPSPDKFFEALENKHWPLVVAIGVTIVVWFIRYIFKEKLPKKYLPYIMMGCIVLSGAATRIIQFADESKPWWQGMIQGLLEGITVGSASMGLWSAGGKALLPNIKPTESSSDTPE